MAHSADHRCGCSDCFVCRSEFCGVDLKNYSGCRSSDPGADSLFGCACGHGRALAKSRVRHVCVWSSLHWLGVADTGKQRHLVKSRRNLNGRDVCLRRCLRARVRQSFAPRTRVDQSHSRMRAVADWHSHFCARVYSRHRRLLPVVVWQRKCASVGCSDHRLNSFRLVGHLYSFCAVSKTRSACVV